MKKIWKNGKFWTVKILCNLFGAGFQVSKTIGYKLECRVEAQSEE